MNTHLCGAGMAFLGFSLSLIIGLYVGNPFITVVTRGLVVLMLFYVLGCLLFVLGQKVVHENFEAEKAARQAQQSLNNEQEDSPQSDSDQPLPQEA